MVNKKKKMSMLEVNKKMMEAIRELEKEGYSTFTKFNYRWTDKKK